MTDKSLDHPDHEDVSDELEHSPIGASSSNRWMRCPGSVRALRNIEDRPSKPAAEGTAAHAIAEECLRDGTDADEHEGRVLEVDGWEFEVDEDMVNGVQLFLDVMRETQESMGAKEIFPEQRMSLERVRPGMFGTCDASAIKGKRLAVGDFKYGRVRVSARENSQGLYYALGALFAMDPHKKVEEIEIIIVQPRTPDPVRRWVVTRDYMKKWAKVLRKAADATRDPDAPRIPGAIQCEWCDFKTHCPELETYVHERASIEFDDDDEFVSAEGVTDGETDDVEDLAPSIVRRTLEWGPLVKSYIDACETKAAELMEMGVPLKGYKLVERRAHRKWKGAVPVTEKALRAKGLTKKSLYKDPALKSPAQVEKLLPKDQRSDIAYLYSAESSGHKVVPEADPAPAARAGAASDFADD